MPNKSPLISVVIPSYNQKIWLEEAILSVINQNYEAVEIILMDGGSTDGSLDIIEKYKSHFSYWVSEKDNGQTDALIKGFEKSNGDLMCWVNSDDILLPNTFNTAAKYYLKDKEIAILFGDMLLIDKDGLIIKCFKSLKYFHGFFAKKGHWLFNGTGGFFSRKHYIAVGGLHVELYYVMDSDLYMRILQSGGRCKHIGMYSGGFRKHEDAKTVAGADNLLNSPKESKNEHYEAAKKYWTESSVIGYKQKRWRIIYYILQILTGNFTMYFSTLRWKGKNYKHFIKHLNSKKIKN